MAQLAIRVGAPTIKSLLDQPLPDLMAMLTAAGLTGELIRLSEPERRARADRSIAGMVKAAKAYGNPQQ